MDSEDKERYDKGRNQYSLEFEKQALERAGKDGVAATARDLNLNEGQTCAWRQKRLKEIGARRGI